ncbi:MAG: alpha-D-ribose 1-methylphosphonate 5-phosphate C-P-lyase PhnJ [Oscillospiraceae bacterium]|jgi:alpha-D-ribose 1-methylphosphonate 5-phosphate C-P lyase|nr:alpha-D-ribose 1-methylphosphonate 5-phosphate C-P-lyase PhnJ [Oscillospiraceae bacterium]
MVKKRSKHYNFAFLDEGSKRVIRRALLKAVAIPGYQVPFGSRELPIGRGWGTGGLQITLSVIGPGDVLKVIDQGSDDSVNALSIRNFVTACTGVETTTDSGEATLIQSRHRIPEAPLKAGQIMALQVPMPEPLRLVEPHEAVTRVMHAEMDYAPMWLALYESIVRTGDIELGADYPVMVEDRYMMMPSPIPRFDNHKLHMSPALFLFGAGREKKIYALPPYTRVVSLAFDDHPFRVESTHGRVCRLCGAADVYFDEFFDSATGGRLYQCSDSGYCEKRRRAGARATEPAAPTA